MESDNASLWYNKARCEVARRDRAGALKSLGKAISLDPNLKATAIAEDDLASLRNDPDFLRLVK
jgi:hypothetical protein